MNLIKAKLKTQREFRILSAKTKIQAKEIAGKTKKGYKKYKKKYPYSKLQKKARRSSKRLQQTLYDSL